MSMVRLIFIAVFLSPLASAILTFEPVPIPPPFNPANATFDNYFNPEWTMAFDEYSKKMGYPVEKHEVTTADGYILEIFRLQAKGQKKFSTNKKPVLMWHPLLGAADLMIVNQEHKAPGFILANEGYDVWFGNCRGTRYGLKHKTMDSDKDNKFWDFSWQHHASFDLPATVAYIHNHTGKSMDYLGHSQGTLIIVAALAEKNQIIEKYVDKVLLFGPAPYIRHAYSPIISWFLKGPSKSVFHALGIKRFLPYSETFNGIAAAICSVIPTVCKWGLIYSSWEEPLFDDEELMPKLGGHMPAGTSSMNMEHFGQMIGMTEDKLQKFDYGTEEENFKAYGRPTPPVYDIKSIKRHLYLFAGLEDTLADIRDVRQLNEDLPNTTYKEYKNTGHCTFFLGKDVNAYMEDIVSVLATGSLAVPQSPQNTNN